MSYTFKIDNSIIQYHKSANTFRIGLEGFNSMCLCVNVGDEYYSNNYYVLKKIPQEHKEMMVKLTECEMHDLSVGDLIYDSIGKNIKHLNINSVNLKTRENFAFVLNARNDNIDIVKVNKSDINVIRNIKFEKIYKVEYVEIGC